MHKLVLTKMDTDFGCDLKFPDFNWEEFEENSDFPEGKQEEIDRVSKKPVTYQIVSYTKKSSIRELDEKNGHHEPRLE